MLHSTLSREINPSFLESEVGRIRPKTGLTQERVSHQLRDAFPRKASGLRGRHESVPQGEGDRRNDEAGVGDVLAGRRRLARPDLSVLYGRRVDHILEKTRGFTNLSHHC